MTSKFRAACFHGGKRVNVLPQPVVTPQPGYLRVRVRHCGVCASNVPPWAGRPWFTYPLAPGAPGHEATGEVEEVGDGVEGWNIGDRVAYIGEHGFAELENVATGGLLRLPRDLHRDFLGEPLACAMNIFRRAAIQSGDVVAMVGTGFLGRLLTQLVLDCGARVIAVARRDSEVDTRATLIVSENRTHVLEQVGRLTSGRMCDVVIEATGVQESLDLAAELTRVRGRLVIAGYHQEERRVNMQLWNWRGLDVINAHEREPHVYLEGMRLALETVQSGRWKLDGLISHRFPLEELGEALRCAADRPAGFTKAVIDL